METSASRSEGSTDMAGALPKRPDMSLSSSGRANPGLTPMMLNHAAWVTPDAETTAEFYTRIMGMDLVSTVIEDTSPSTGLEIPYFHLFFRMGDGSTLAFFEAPGVPPSLLDDLVGNRLCHRVGHAAGAEFAVGEHEALVVEVVDRQKGSPAGACGHGDLGGEPCVA